MEQKVAVIGQIQEIKPIPNADRIESAVVVCGAAGKWAGTIEKGAFSLNEHVVVFLQDALLPEGDPRWSFMEKNHWRVSMRKFLGVPSECLIIKLPTDDTYAAMSVGDDVADIFGVKKYIKEIPATMNGEFKGPFPSFIPITDEVNFQAFPEYRDWMAKEPYYVSIKYDGISGTAWNDEEGLHVCTRHNELNEFNNKGNSNVYWKMARKYNMDKCPQGLALQFEVVGPGIQKNTESLKENEVRLFRIWDIEKREYYDYGQLMQFSTDYNIPMVHVISNPGDAPSEDGLRFLAEVKYANGKPGEGIVIAAMRHRVFSFKVINLLYKD